MMDLWFILCDFTKKCFDWHNFVDVISLLENIVFLVFLHFSKAHLIIFLVFADPEVCFAIFNNLWSRQIHKCFEGETNGSL